LVLITQIYHKAWSI
jgi:hypothetical protein